MSTLSQVIHKLWNYCSIVFSAVQFDRLRAKILIKEITVALAALGFKRNETKTHVVPPSARRVVTGLLVAHQHRD